MRLEITTRAGEGDTILLPPEIALDEYEMSKALSVRQLPGTDGELLNDKLTRLTTSVLRASGSVKYSNRNVAEQTARYIRGKLADRKGVKIKYDDWGVHTIANCVRIITNLNRGHYGGSMVTYEILFEVLSPFWFADDEKEYVFDNDHQVDNMGDVDVQSVIEIKADGSDLVNPEIENTATGALIEYNGTINNGDVLVIDCEERTAIIDEDNVLKNLNTGFLVRGLMIVAGTNPIKISKDSGDIEVTIRFRERWV